MSLLIKALDKAQNAKTEQEKAENEKIEHAALEQAAIVNTEKVAKNDLELSLSPAESALAEPVAPAKVGAGIQDNNQAVRPNTGQIAKNGLTPALATPKNAANVFSAKGIEASNQNTRLALIAGAGLLVLLAMALYFYQFVDNTPAIVVPQRPADIAQQQNQTLPQPEAGSTLPVTEPPTEPVQTAAIMPQTPASAETAPLIDAENKQTQSNVADESLMADEDAAFDAIAAPKKPVNKSSQSDKSLSAESIASPSVSIRAGAINISKSKSQSGINSVLMGAYQAYKAGNDNDAQRLYKQVLQQDIRNVDALLGLGAIASRQGRVADANGWYGEVLEVDPRNNIAQTALLSHQSQGLDVNSESRIKNMLAQHPDDANLHVALGNFYAQQNQWPAAQQAYFDAYSLNASAVNAFNLAVSLDQMGKPKLALPYYQSALAQSADSNSIDKNSLEARIAAIQ